MDMFVNTLTADDNYSLLNKDIFLKPIEIQLSKKRKTFCQSFSAFSKFRSNFELSEKKHDLHRLFISEITDWERPS